MHRNCVNLVLFNFFSSGSPVLKYKEGLCTALFSFLSHVNLSLCAAAVECFMVLVELKGLLNEKEASLCLKDINLEAMQIKECVKSASQCGFDPG